MLEEFVLLNQLQRLVFLLRSSMSQLSDCYIVSLQVQADLLPELDWVFDFLEGLDVGDVLLGILLRAAGSHGRQLQIVGEKCGLVDSVGVY